jgi:hypothetical protein
MNNHLVVFGDEEINGLARVRERDVFGRQVLPQLIASANDGLTEGAAMADKLRRQQLIKSQPVLSVDGIDKGTNECFVLFNGHNAKWRELFAINLKSSA